MIGTKYNCGCKDCNTEGKFEITAPNKTLPLPSHCKKKSNLAGLLPSKLRLASLPSKAKIGTDTQICWANTSALHWGAKVQEYHVTCFFKKYWQIRPTSCG
jgi:hypothetical protein